MEVAERKFIRRPAVSVMTGRSKAALYVDISAGKFPRPIRIGSRAVAWDVSEVQEWMQSQVSARDSMQTSQK